MSYFSFTVPGQPVSWNQAFRVRMRNINGVRTRGLYKTSEAEAYQDGIRLIAKVARPTSFVLPKRGRIIVAYDFVLKTDIDCDNLLKLMNDALAEAIGHNDKFFMPVVMSKTLGSKNPMTTVTVYDASRWRVMIHPE